MQSSPLLMLPFDSGGWGAWREALRGADRLGGPGTPWEGGPGARADG